MFMMIGGKRCPSCGVVGKNWKRKPTVFVCPLCNTIFNEFGLIASGKERDITFT